MRRWKAALVMSFCGLAVAAPPAGGPGGGPAFGGYVDAIGIVHWVDCWKETAGGVTTVKANAEFGAVVDGDDQDIYDFRGSVGIIKQGPVYPWGTTVAQNPGQVYRLDGTDPPQVWQEETSYAVPAGGWGFFHAFAFIEAAPDGGEYLPEHSGHSATVEVL